MKDLLILILTAAAVLSLSGCSGSGAPAGSKAAGSNAVTVAQILEDAAQDPPDAAPETPAPANVLEGPRSDDMDLSSADADVDLTLLSSTMVYSEVSRMIYEPDNYVGKTIKMTGAFAIYEGEGRNYYACIIKDATACCANGIEFDWAGEHIYPDDYPEPGADITVVGTFELYEEDGFMYSQLADAQVDF